MHMLLSALSGPCRCERQCSMHAQGKSGMQMYHDFEEGRSKGDFSILPELHATLAGMKVRSLPAPACNHTTGHIKQYHPASLAGWAHLRVSGPHPYLCRCGT